MILMFQLNGKAQELPSIQTDRPDQTECPFIVPVHYFQFEAGFSYQKGEAGTSEVVAPTVLTRFGVNDHFELRLITEYVIDRNAADRTSGIDPVAVGLKTRLFEEKGIVPLTSFMGHIALAKAASREFKSTYYAPDFRLTMQHTLSKRQALGYNLGAEWDGESAEPIFVYTVTTGYSFSDKVGGFIELYGFVPQGGTPDHRFDAGVTYLIASNHQVDLSGGVGMSEISPDYFLSVGYSFRFKI
jgi:hypothetical protein